MGRRPGLTQVIAAPEWYLPVAAIADLTSAAARAMTEEDAAARFAAMRWAHSGGEPVCPRCGCADHYYLRERRLWKCLGCLGQFSVTAGTIFAGRKLPFRNLMIAFAIFIEDPHEFSATKLAARLSIQYKAAWNLAGKIRVAFQARGDAERFRHGDARNP